MAEHTQNERLMLFGDGFSDVAGKTWNYRLATGPFDIGPSAAAAAAATP